MSPTAASRVGYTRAVPAPSRTAAIAVRRRPGGQLLEPPHGRVERGEGTDAGQREAGGGEQDREEAPGEAVVEVVDHTRLAGRGQGGFAEADQGENLTGGQPAVMRAGGGDAGGGLVVGVPARLAYGQRGQAEAERGVGGGEQERGGPQPVVGGQGPGGHGGAGERGVAGGFVESHREATASRADQVDLHDDGGGPGQPLVDAEQDVRGDDPAPGRCPDQQERYRDGDEPAGEQDGFAAVAVGQGAGEEVDGGLGGAEGEDVGQRGGVGAEVEGVFGQQRQHGAFGAEQPADQGVDRDEQAELGGVGGQAQPRRCRAGAGVAGAGGHAPCSSGQPVASAQSSAPPTSTARLWWPARSSRVAAVIARSPCPHMTTAGPAGAASVLPGRVPSSMWTAPGRCPAPMSAIGRTSTATAPSASSRRTRAAPSAGRAGGVWSTAGPRRLTSASRSK